MPGTLSSCSDFPFDTPELSYSDEKSEETQGLLPEVSEPDVLETMTLMNQYEEIGGGSIQ